MMELSQGKTQILSVVFSLITLSLFLVGAAQAATFCVSDATGLHNAVSQAASNGEDDIIQMVQGTYIGNFIYASTEDFGVTVEGGYTADCASREVDPANTVLDGDVAGNVLVLSCPDQAVEFVVDGVTLQNGNASNYGGGLFAKTDDGEVILTNNTITGNSAAEGGGVYSYGSTVTITNNTITENSAEGGGGVYVSGYGSTTVTLTNNTITGNSAGGVRVDGSTVTLTNNTITENSGGGVSVGGSTVILTNNTITENSGGSGVHAYAGGSTVTLTNNTITGNSAGYGGGGVDVSGYPGGSTVTLTNNTITGNSAEGSGGGVYVDGSITLTNNTITGNSAGGNGGGVDVSGYSSTVTLTNNTITGNSADDGGGGVYVYLYDNSYTAHIYNNIIYNNTAVSDGNDLFINNDRNGDFIPSLVNLYNNDFDQSAFGTYIEIPFSIDPSNLDNLDPLFVDATSGNYRPINSSPCIDAGDNSAPALPETDKDGQPRIMDGIVDMGAYEYSGSATTVAGFTAVPTNGVAPLGVNFTDQSTGTITSWEWDFGDGETSTEQNPSHTYQNAGTYTVTLAVTGPGGSDTEKGTITVITANDWVTNPSNGHSYKLTEYGSWQDCENEAVNMGAHLVTINDQDEQDWLVQTFGCEEWYWIGLTDETEEGNWIWISGELVSYTNWGPDQPDDYEGCEDWAHMNFTSSGKWNDLGPRIQSTEIRGIIEKANTSSLSVTPLTINISVGETQTLTITGGSTPYTVTSSNEYVATAVIDYSNPFFWLFSKTATVTVTGVADGTATITISDSKSNAVTVSVTVGDACEVATLSEDLRLHIPELRYQSIFGEMWLRIDLEYMPGTDDNIFFRVTDFEIIEPSQIDACEVVTLAQDLTMHVAQLHYQTLLDNFWLWVDFEYVPSTDDDILFKVTGFGVID